MGSESTTAYLRITTGRLITMLLFTGFGVGSLASRLTGPGGREAFVVHGLFQGLMHGLVYAHVLRGATDYRSRLLVGAAALLTLVVGSTMSVAFARGGPPAYLWEAQAFALGEGFAVLLTLLYATRGPRVAARAPIHESALYVLPFLPHVLLETVREDACVQAAGAGVAVVLLLGAVLTIRGLKSPD